MSDEILDMLDQLADQQKDWKRSRSPFAVPVFAKKSANSRSLSPEEDDQSKIQSLVGQVPAPSETMNRTSQKESLNDSASQDYHFALSNLVRRAAEPEPALFEPEQDVVFYNERDTSFQDLNDEMDKEIKAIQDEYPLTTPRQSQQHHSPKSRFQSFSNNHDDIIEHTESDSSDQDSTNNVTRLSQVVPQQPKAKPRPPQAPQPVEQRRPLLYIKIDHGLTTFTVAITRNDTEPTILAQLEGKFPKERIQRILEMILEQVSQYLTTLEGYLHTHKLTSIKSDSFRKFTKTNTTFLLDVQRSLPKPRSATPTSPTKRSLSQLSKESYYRDRSLKSLHASTTLLQKHASPSPKKPTLQLSPAPAREPYYDFSVSPNCSRHPKLSMLMKDPPNMTTSRDVDGIYIKSTSKKNEFVTFELVLGANRVGKITVNRRKVLEETQLKLLHQRLNVQQSNDSKEIATTVEKFCIRHKLNTKQRGKIVKILQSCKDLQ